MTKPTSKVKKVLDNYFTKKRESGSYVNHKELTKLLNQEFGDQRYSAKILAGRTDNSSMIMKYRDKEYYCYLHRVKGLSNKWEVE